MSEHTPGPWKVVDAITPEGGERWFVRGPDQDTLVSEADARLIAKAPEMYALIRRIAREWPDVAEAMVARALLREIEGNP